MLYCSPEYPERPRSGMIFSSNAIANVAVSPGSSGFGRLAVRIVPSTVNPMESPSAVSPFTSSHPRIDFGSPTRNAHVPCR
jgi:hypothetical protein